MTATPPAAEVDLDLGSARRNVALWAAPQPALGGPPPIAFAIGGLAAYQMLGVDKSLATAPLTGFNIGTAAGTIVVAILARYLPRRLSFIFGALLLGCSGLIAAIAVYRNDFWLFVAGLMLTGVAAGFTQKFRFAAADASPSFYKSTAISWILAGGIISAV